MEWNGMQCNIPSHTLCTHWLHILPFPLSPALFSFTFFYFLFFLPIPPLPSFPSSFLCSPSSSFLNPTGSFPPVPLLSFSSFSPFLPFSSFPFLPPHFCAPLPHPFCIQWAVFPQSLLITPLLLILAAILSSSQSQIYNSQTSHRKWVSCRS